jgi:hypothetical protein
MPSIFGHHILSPSSSERFWEIPAEPEGFTAPGDKFPLQTPAGGTPIDAALDQTLADMELTAEAQQITYAALDQTLEDLGITATAAVHIYAKLGETGLIHLEAMTLDANAQVVVGADLDLTLEDVVLSADAEVTGDMYHLGTTVKWRVPVL